MLKEYMCIKKCQHGGRIWPYKVGEILNTDVTPPEHCFKPLDERIAEIEEEKAGSSSEIEQARTELTELGVAFDKRWGLPRLQSELLKTKKMRGK